MGIDTPDFVPEEEKIDLTNMEEVLRILENGTPEEMEELRVFHNLTPEKVRLFSDFAKLRRRTVEQCEREGEERREQNPKATDEELSAGVYKEYIEPQVRDAVSALRRKGYTTYESGFDYDRQIISFEKNHLEGFQLSGDLAGKMAEMGVKVEIRPNAISLTFEKYFDLDEIKKIWDEIAAAMPDLGGLAEPSQLEGAESFRRKQALEEKIALVEKKLAIKYTEEEKEEFDRWLAQTPENSDEKPISIVSIEEVAAFLPKTANYRDEQINIFFAKKEFAPEEMHAVLENFARQNPSFEISLVKHGDGLISIGVGNKARNISTIFNGEYFGHYHPTQFKLENEETLPKCFVMGLMPSAGDINGFFKHPKTIKEGTKIFSQNGYVFIRPTREVENPERVLGEFRQKYFDLFLGENKFGFKSDEEVANYFREKLGFEIKFNYSGQSEQEKQMTVFRVNPESRDEIASYYQFEIDNGFSGLAPSETFDQRVDFRQRQMRNRELLVVMAKEGEQIVATAVVVLKKGTMGKNIAEDEAWAAGTVVLPDKRSAGIGEKLAREQGAIAREAGKKSILTRIAPDNYPSARLYMKVGYQLENIDKRGGEVHYVYRKDLTGEFSQDPKIWKEKVEEGGLKIFGGKIDGASPNEILVDPSDETQIQRVLENNYKGVCLLRPEDFEEPGAIDKNLIVFVRG